MNKKNTKKEYENKDEKAYKEMGRRSKRRRKIMRLRRK